MLGEPYAWGVGEERVECGESVGEDKREASGCGLKHGVGHAFAGGREDKEGCVAAVFDRVTDLAGERDGLGEAEFPDSRAQI